MLQICIVGCGDMGRAHAAAWMNRGDARIVAVCDPLEERREQLAAFCHAKPYAGYREALQHPGVQVVSVCTPVCFHAEVACFAAERGCHVLVEKPISLTLAQADAMIECAAQHKALLSVSYQYRGFTRHIKYRQMIRNGEFGGPVFFHFTDIREVRPKTAMHRRSMNGGPLIDMASHYFDLVRYFTGENPLTVYAQGHVFGEGKARLAGVQDLAVDAASVQVAYGGGHTLVVFVNWGMPEGFGCIQDEMLTGPALCARSIDGDIECRRGAEKELWKHGEEPEGPAVRIADLVGAIRGESPLEVTGHDGRLALQVSLAALESIRTKRTCKILLE